jgi:hypothetical protein
MWIFSVFERVSTRLREYMKFLSQKYHEAVKICGESGGMEKETPLAFHEEASGALYD